MSSLRRIAIVGGGLSGLACARALSVAAAKTGERLDIVVLEASSRFGGIIETDHQDDFVMDHGPDGWVTTKPEAGILANDLGLASEIIPTIEKNRHVYIAHGGALHAMPEGLVLGIPTRIAPIVKTPLFSLRAKARMALEPFISRGDFEGDGDESIGTFIERRLGREVADRLVGPLLGGIFAGDASAISVRAAFPQLVEAERKHGSLLRAMRAQKRNAPSNGKSPSMFASLRGGMGRLIEALVRDLEKRDDVRLKTNAAVRKVTRQTAIEAGKPGPFAIELQSGSIEHADVLVVATPVRAAADVLRSVDENVASQIESMMNAVSSATAFFAFDRKAIDHRLDATGFIVPHGADQELLASTWVSSKWEGRAPDGRVLIRGFLGGAGHEATLDKSDDELSTVALLELRKLLPISGSPLFSRVFRFDKLSPQPRVGHLARERALRERLSTLPGVYLLGNGYQGVGMPTCIKNATDAASAIVNG